MADPGTLGLADVRRVLVVGLGTSGRAAASLLSRAGIEVTVADDDPAGRTPVSGAALHDGPTTGLDPSSFDAVVPSPGVPEHAVIVQAALAASVPVWSEPEVAWRARPGPLVGITGTNGKTTVTGLVADMLVRSGLEAVACGNIGTPMSSVVANLATGQQRIVLVAELSSFQLRFVHRLSPAVGVILNVSPDHLDWHGSVTAYRAAKARLLANADEATTAVAGDDPVARELVAGSSAGTTLFTSATESSRSGVGVRDGQLHASLPGHPDADLIATTDLPSSAPHVVSNAAAAAAAALAAGATVDGVVRALAAWEIGPHRLGLVAEVDGVRWVDDSKATNVHATIAALASADSIVWIAGGQAKGMDLAVLGSHLEHVRHAVLLGESADMLAAVCATSNVPVSRAGTMREAVEMAAAEARPGDTVLLSPAGASFDLFDGYADRGDRFATAVREVATGQEHR